MSIRFQFFGLIAWLALPSSFAQVPTRPDGKRLGLSGTLVLVDKPIAATPVEYLGVAIQQLHGGLRFDARPDHDGNFTLTNVPPGRYSLNLPFPGRVQMFANGSRSLMPDQFEFKAGESGPLRIVVSLKTSVLSVDVSGISTNTSPVIAVVYPADPYLMPPYSGILNRVSGHQTQFRYLVPGTYTLFVADEDFKWALTSPAVRNALKDKATAVQVRDDGETKVTTTCLTPDTVRQAITGANWKDPREMFEKQPGKAHEK